MKTVIITRKKQLANALLPYWIIPAQAVEQQPTHFQTLKQVRLDATGHPRPTLNPESLAEIGAPVRNGETVTLTLPDGVRQIYAVTMDGLLSNPAALTDGETEYRFTVTTKGGFVRPPHPILKAEQEGSA